MKPTTEKSSFGALPDGTAVDLYTLTNANGLVAKVITYGTIITELHVPDRAGQTGDVVLGFDNLGQYLKGHPFFGCTVGRVANRIARGHFTLYGKTYQLAVNNGPNHLHGGLKGFDKVVWHAEPQADAAVKFSYSSADGEEGYPGKVDVTVLMTLTDANGFQIDYTAVSDQLTPINLTNHSYFNLAGSGSVLDHVMMIAASEYTPTDMQLIPTGEILPVKGTPLDFTTPAPIGSRMRAVVGPKAGYDHNYIVNRGGSGLALTARVHEPATGRTMEVHTTQPGVQLYTANYLDGSLTGKYGIVYGTHSAFCLETQHFPDSVNHPNFPSTILRPGQTFRQSTVYTFLNS
ncbi:MAG TPA: aldose epimerase family protein [Verrucomicrobiae bacterium]